MDGASHSSGPAWHESVRRRARRAPPAPPTRRAGLSTVGEVRTGSATIPELAVIFGMSLPGVSKHLTVLEHAGLVVRTVEGRVRRCSLRPGPLREADSWLVGYRSFWESALDSL